MPTFNTIDLAILALLALGTVRGTFRGLSGELASTIGLVVAAVAGWHFYEPLGQYLTETTRMTPIQADTVSFVVVIGGALILLWALAIILKSIMEFTFKGGLEKVGGAVMGLVRYAVLIAALLLVTYQFATGTAREIVIHESWFGRHTTAELAPLYEELVQRYPDLPPLTGPYENDEPEPE